MGNADNPDSLEACMETVHRLEEENDQLRQSAGAFGQLAERLNQTLREVGSERRQAPRPSTERRNAIPSRPT